MLVLGVITSYYSFHHVKCRWPPCLLACFLPGFVVCWTSIGPSSPTTYQCLLIILRQMGPFRQIGHCLTNLSMTSDNLHLHDFLKLDQGVVQRISFLLLNLIIGLVEFSKEDGDKISLPCLPVSLIPPAFCSTSSKGHQLPLAVIDKRFPIMFRGNKPATFSQAVTYHNVLRLTW